MNDNWALERLLGIIQEHEKTIVNMAKEICKLRGFISDNDKILEIKREFEQKNVKNI